MPHLVQEDEKYNTILHRNSTYRKDARGRCKGLGVYDNIATIQAAVQQQVQFQGADYSNRLTMIKFVHTCSKYTFDYNNLDRFPPILNWQRGSRPFGNQAHHIVVCELFYNDWDAEELEVVLQAGYDINNPENIVYLPQAAPGDYRSCQFHLLPNHGDPPGHGGYNDQVVGHLESLKSMVSEALIEKDCEKEKEIKKRIYEFLKGLERAFLGVVLAKGPGPLG